MAELLLNALYLIIVKNSLRVLPNEGVVMPRYFFHLSFGDRLLPDEEGVELASRSAARKDAQAVVRELSDSVANRWASWFLRVADDRGQFLSLPLGHPALELVSNAGRSSSTLTPSPETNEHAYGRRRAAALPKRGGALFAEALALRRRTAELLERNRHLRVELSAEFRSAKAAGNRACQLTAYVQHETSEPDIYRIAARRRSPPHLVLIQGESKF